MKKQIELIWNKYIIQTRNPISTNKYQCDGWKWMISHHWSSVLAGSGLSFGETGRYSCPKAIWECANAQGRSHIGRSKRNEANKCKRGSGPGFVWTFLRATTSYYELLFSAFMRFFERQHFHTAEWWLWDCDCQNNKSALKTLKSRLFKCLVGGAVKTCCRKPQSRTTHAGLYQSVHHESTFSSCSGLLQPSTLLFPNLVTSIAIKTMIFPAF